MYEIMHGLALDRGLWRDDIVADHQLSNVHGKAGLAQEVGNPARALALVDYDPCRHK
jgi:hypothetical protein